METEEIKMKYPSGFELAVHIKELQDIPDEDMPKLLEIIHYLKTGMKESRKKVRVKKGQDPLFDLRNIAVETGIKDLAEHHDYYLYGVSK